MLFWVTSASAALSVNYRTE